MPFRLSRLLILGLAAAAIATPGLARAEARMPEGRDAIRLSFAPLVKRVAPAVVNIRTRAGADGQSPLLNDPFYRRYFGIPEQGRPNSVGSGVIVRPDGLVVTNFHVVDKATSIEVITADKRQFAARVLVQDQRTDLAILKIDAPGENLPFIEIGDSDALEVGDFVLAIGNPFGVGQTVTSGIVSALARTVTNLTDLRSFIQTDAAINPGNSGGALITLDGKLVGINTAIISRGGGSVGIGFAIPAAMVASVTKAAEQGGVIRRPTLGIGGTDVTAEIARELGLKRVSGVVVREVYAGSAAEKHGIKVNDVIIRLNDRDLEDIQDLRFRLATLEIGATARVTLIRDGKEMTIEVKLEAAPEATPGTVIQGANPFAGAEVAELTPERAAELRIRDTRGVVVVRVLPNSRAQRVRLQAGDVILQVNGVDIVNVAALQQAINQPQPGGWQIALRRQGRILSAVIPQ
jgi:serine protease Do